MSRRPSRPLPFASRPPTRSLLGRVAVACMVALGVGAAVAEKSDRQQPLTIEADRSSTVDLARKVVVFNGQVVLTQGSLVIRAERMEVTDVGNGHRTASATGLPQQPAEFRQKRDGVNEFVEGRGQAIEYDSREELLRLNGQAVVRRLRGSQLADEVVGDRIVWNGAKELFSVLPSAPTAGVPGRVRATIIPAESAPGGGQK